MESIGPVGNALVRTFVPLLVGAVLALAANAGFDLDSTTLETVLVPVFGSLYYGGVLWLQNHVSPSFGWLLGSPAIPSYGDVVETEVPLTEDGVPNRIEPDDNDLDFEEIYPEGYDVDGANE